MNQVQTILKKYSKAIIIGVLILLQLITLKACNNRNDQLQQEKRNNQLITMSFEQKLSKAGSDIARQEQMIVQKGSDLAKAIEENDYLKSIKTQIKVITRTEHDSFPVAIDRPIYIRDDTSHSLWLKVPASFSKVDQWYTIKGVITDKGTVMFDSLAVINQPIIQIGYKKDGFWKDLLKKPIPAITYQDKNPYSHVTSLSNIQIQDNTRRKTFGVGVQVGYGITQYGLTSYIGLGFNYSPIQF